MSRITPLVVSLAAVLVASCEVPRGQCNGDSDCSGGQQCFDGSCAACGSSADCADDQFCCQGACLASTSIDAHCGCSTSPTGSAGQTCNGGDTPDGLCLVGDTTATAATASQGVCGCGCTPDKGGPTCAPPTNAGDPPQCVCSENSDCRKAAEDATGHPHRAADTCTPQSTCVCFSLGTATACDPTSTSPDCTSSGGCASLVDDVHNCGVPGRDCTQDATGIAGTGTCVDGGCSCDGNGDCNAANVDTCAFPPQGSAASCVCAGYRRAGVVAPCPMELACSAAGCTLDGTAYASEADLLGALGLPPAP